MYTYVAAKKQTRTRNRFVATSTSAVQEIHPCHSLQTPNRYLFQPLHRSYTLPLPHFTPPALADPHQDYLAPIRPIARWTAVVPSPTPRNTLYSWQASLEVASSRTPPPLLPFPFPLPCCNQNLHQLRHQGKTERVLPTAVQKYRVRPALFHISAWGADSSSKIGTKTHKNVKHKKEKSKLLKSKNKIPASDICK